MDNKLEKKLWQKARFASWLLSIIPFVKMISVNGSLATGNIKSTSDVDFFIIVEQNRLWTVRLLSIILLDLFLLRAKKNHHQGKICINHFLTNENYIFSPQNKYNAWQYSNLKVLYNVDNSHNKFIGNNIWMNKYYQFKQTKSPANKIGYLKLLSEFMLKSLLGNYIENKSKGYQTNKINNNSFFHQTNSILKTTNQEFYYYTNVKEKTSKIIV